MKTHGEFNPSRRQLLTGASAIAAARLVGYVRGFVSGQAAITAVAGAAARQKSQ